MEKSIKLGRILSCLELLMFLFCARVSAQGFGRTDLPDWGKPATQNALSELKQNTPRWLVRASVTNITTDDRLPNVSRSIWRIDYVFSGPDELIGKEFGFSHFRGGNSIYLPPTTIGIKGIWRVAWGKDTVIPARSERGSPGYGLSLPIVEGYTKRAFAGFVLGPSGLRRTRKLGRKLNLDYAEAEAYAASIERVVKAGRNEQIRLLAVYAKSPMPQRSAWAIRTLAQSGLEDAPKFLSDLVPNLKVPLQGQVALEESLAELDKEEWDFSSRRLDLWRRMMTSRATEEEAYQVMSRLNSLSQGEFNRTAAFPLKTKLFGLTKLAATNPQWTLNTRAYVLRIIGDFAERKQIDRAAAFAFLLPFVQRHPDFARESKPSPKPNNTKSAASTREAAREEATSLALGALSGIFSLKPLTTSQTATLRSLLSRAKDRILISHLRQTLNLEKPL